MGVTMPLTYRLPNWPFTRRLLKEPGDMGFIRNDAGDMIPPFGGEGFPWIGGDLQTIRHFLRDDAPPPPPSTEILIDLDDGDSGESFD